MVVYIVYSHIEYDEYSSDSDIECFYLEKEAEEHKKNE